MKLRNYSACAAAIVTLLMASNARAQDPGPQAPPPKYEVKRISPEPAAGPPPIPAQEIIQKFTANEDVMKKAFDTFTFSQTIRMQELSDPGGAFSVTGQVYSKPDGQRYMRMAQQPVSTLKLTHFSLEDVREFSSIPLFPLTSDESPNYIFKYAGEEKLDQLNTFIFQVKPKMLSRKKRYFEGVIWVDTQDFVIVKSYGKFVSELSGNGFALPFTMFETYRENIQGKYWLPTYTRSDDYYKLEEKKEAPQPNRSPNDISDGHEEPPQQASSDPVEELPLRLVIRSTDFSVQSGVPAEPGANAGDASTIVPVKPH
jgi:hypothetical protein